MATVPSSCTRRRTPDSLIALQSESSHRGASNGCWIPRSCCAVRWRSAFALHAHHTPTMLACRSTRSLPITSSACLPVQELVDTPQLWTPTGLLEAFAQRTFPCVDQSAVRTPQTDPNGSPRHEHCSPTLDLHCHRGHILTAIIICLPEGPPRCHMRLLDYMAYMESQASQPHASDREPLYLFDDAPPRELLADLRPPAQLNLDLLEDAATLRNERRNGRSQKCAVGQTSAAGTFEGDATSNREMLPRCYLEGKFEGIGGVGGGGGGGGNDDCGYGGRGLGEDVEEEREEEEEEAGLLDERRWLVVGPCGSGCRWHQVCAITLSAC